MKQVKKAVAAPRLLATFAATRPDADWDRFKNSKSRYIETTNQIRNDQRGVCAYCEIDLLKAAGPGTVPDFRVEHFHPKSPHAPPPNWSIDWTNLLGTCHGGSQRDVTDPARYTAPDLCCDVPKGDQNWTANILNPLTEVPAFPRLFEYSESDGAMDIDPRLCPDPLTQKASESITRLNLNASRLARMRRAVIAGLRDQISQMLEAGASVQDASEQLASAMFPSDTDKEWPAFFTCIRWYLGEAAEDRLLEIGYA